MSLATQAAPVKLSCPRTGKPLRELPGGGLTTAAPKPAPEIPLEPLRPRKARQARPTHGTCGMTLRINGVPYRVRPLYIDPELGTRAFRLTKADGTAYDLACGTHGRECTCPDFVYARDGIDPAGCKHVKAGVALGLL
jgi:hypothetical protein